MNISQLSSYLSVSVLTLATAFVASKPAFSQTATFVCAKDTNGDPATVVKSPQHGDVPIIAWSSGHFADAGFDNQTRCDIVSQKFQAFSDRGTLKFFTSGKVNKQPVICVVASQNDPCNNSSMLFTLKKESDPQKTLQRLFDIRSGATSEVLNENNNGERLYLNFEEILEHKANQGASTPQRSSSVGKEAPRTNLF